MTIESYNGKRMVAIIEDMEHRNKVVHETIRRIIDEAPKSTPPSVIKRLRELIEGMQR